jgi:hypothetical protein
VASTTAVSQSVRPSSAASAAGGTAQNMTPRPGRSVAATFACIRQYESGGRYSINTGNGYFGAYQYKPSTWDYAAKGAGYGQFANGRADLAPPSVQDAVSVWLQSQVGWSPWRGDGCFLHG